MAILARLDPHGQTLVPGALTGPVIRLIRGKTVVIQGPATLAREGNMAN